MTETIHNLETLRQRVAGWRTESLRVALVPTMGALHVGHMALARAARTHADRVVVSIFVNPTQFGPSEDFSRYPRTLEQDVAMLAEQGVEAVWAPDVATMYPQGFASKIEVAGVSEGLCGAFRPGHFSGVATVVAKLFQQVQPDVALFGEKDYQQLCVIRRMARDLDFSLDIIGVPTVREADGLAHSSRNRYLSEAERAIAPMLHQALQSLASDVKSNMNERLFDACKEQIISAGFDRVEYLELRSGEDLRPLTSYAPKAHLLVAAWLGKTRLIDNIEL